MLSLQQRGYKVDAISNGDDAVALLRGNPYDLVLLDEQMPGKRGLEVLESLRRSDPHARVVMVTKSEEDRTMTEAIGRRVDEYLVKPTSPRQVLSVVHADPRGLLDPAAASRAGLCRPLRAPLHEA